MALLNRKSEYGQQPTWETRPGGEAISSTYVQPTGGAAGGSYSGDSGTSRSGESSGSSTTQSAMTGSGTSSSRGTSSSTNTSKQSGSSTSSSMGSSKSTSSWSATKPLPIAKAEKFSAPKFDEQRIAALAQRFQAPGVRGLRNEVRSAANEAYDNPNAKRMVMRDALAGFGQGLENVARGAYSSALGQYNQEYSSLWNTAMTNFRAEEAANLQNFNAMLTDWQRSGVQTTEGTTSNTGASTSESMTEGASTTEHESSGETSSQSNTTGSGTTESSNSSQYNPNSTTPPGSDTSTSSGGNAVGYYDTSGQWHTGAPSMGPGSRRI